MIAGEVFSVGIFLHYLKRRKEEARNSPSGSAWEQFGQTSRGSWIRATTANDGIEGPYIWHFVLESGAAQGAIFVLLGHMHEEVPEKSLLGLMWAAGSTLVIPNVSDAGRLRRLYPGIFHIPSEVESLLVDLKRQDLSSVEERFRRFRMAVFNSGVCEILDG